MLRETLDIKCILAFELCEGFDQKSLDVVLSKFSGMFSDCPGLCNVVECEINVKEGSWVICKQPHRVPIHIKDEWNNEVQ